MVHNYVFSDEVSFLSANLVQFYWPGHDYVCTYLHIGLAFEKQTNLLH